MRTFARSEERDGCRDGDKRCDCEDEVGEELTLEAVSGVRIQVGARTDLLIVVVVCPGRHFECVSQGDGAKRATVKKGYLVAGQAHVSSRMAVSNPGHGR